VTTQSTLFISIHIIHLVSGYDIEIISHFNREYEPAGPLIHLHILFSAVLLPRHISVQRY